VFVQTLKHRKRIRFAGIVECINPSIHKMEYKIPLG
jgi:hypothetical protein